MIPYIVLHDTIPNMFHMSYIYIYTSQITEKHLEASIT